MIARFSFPAASLLRAAFVVLVVAPPLAAGPPVPPREEVQLTAGRYVADLEERLAVVLGDENYHQSFFVGGKGSPDVRRTLESDVAWVPTGDPLVWAFYRDVRNVDGQPVRDRAARLEALFPTGWTAAARDRAQEILDESARFNLGPWRTVNVPTLALGCLHPRNQSRFEYRVVGREDRAGATCWKLSFREHRRPTLVRTHRGEDVPLQGLVWIEARRGTVVATRLEMSLPEGGTVSIETDYRLDERLGFWLPARMRELYGFPGWSKRGSSIAMWGDNRVEASATYSAWRRAEVEVQVILPVP